VSLDATLVSDCKNFEHSYALNFRKIICEKCYFSLSYDGYTAAPGARPAVNTA
jgi:hypothetical protein